MIIPIKKPGKDPSSPMTDRPIALTSNMGKKMERIVTERLAFYVESKGILSLLLFTFLGVWFDVK